jgi:acetyl esterase/lipase
MRLLLIIMGTFVAVVCLAKPTEARDYAWCAYYNFQHGGATNCGKMRRLIFQTFAFIDRFAVETSFKKTTVAYREIDGHKILADVYRPQDTTIRPVIVWIHGGALITGNRDLEKPEDITRFLLAFAKAGGALIMDNRDLENREDVARFLLAFAKAEGCAVVSIDYRLAPETKLPDIISDIEEAFRWLAGDGANQFHLDPRRIVVVGASAGGYLTLVTGYRVWPKPKALVALYGFGDLIGDWSSKPNPYPFYNLRKISREEAESQTDGTVISDSDKRKGEGSSIYMYYRQNGLWPEGVSGFARSTIADQITPFEPIRNVTPSWPPTLLIHGTLDTDVPYEQSELMAKKFKEKGVPSTLIPIEHGEHLFEGGDPQKIRETYKAMGEFIKEHF